MREYRKTFRRRWYLYLIPPVLAVLVAGYLVATTAKAYESSASLWVDNGPTVGSSLSSGSTATEPSSFEQIILNELLATDSFDLAVGQGSALKNAVTGRTQQAKNGAIEAAVKSGSGSSTAGPQVLLLTYKGSSPTVAQTTLNSLINRLQASTTHYGEDFGQTATSYYQSQLTAARRAQAAARRSLNDYRATHPKATTANNPTYASLSSALSVADTQVTTATQAVNQAQAQARTGVDGATVHVVDQPSLPLTPASGKKKMIMLVGGAAVGGALLSLLLVIGFTKTEEDRWDAEMAAFTASSPTPHAERSLVLRAGAEEPRALERSYGRADDEGTDASSESVSTVDQTEDVDEFDLGDVAEEDDDGFVSDEDQKKRRIFGGARDDRERQ